MLNVSIEEFQKKWSCVNENCEIYSNGSLKGEVVYEDDSYFVIRLK